MMQNWSNTESPTTFRLLGHIRSWLRLIRFRFRAVVFLLGLSISIFTFCEARGQSTQVDVESIKSLIAEGESASVVSFLRILNQSWFKTLEASDLLGYAASLGDTNVVSALAEKGTDPTGAASDGVSALVAAIKGGHEETAIKLLDLGVNPAIASPDGELPVELARELQMTELAERLVPKVGDEGYSSNLNAVTLSLYEAVLIDDIKALLAGLDAGGDVNATPGGGRPLLHSATIASSSDTILALLEAGADSTVVYENQTAYQLALSLERWDIARLLSSDEGNSAGTIELLSAISESDVDRVKALLDQGIDPNILASNGNTPLIEALLNANDEIVQALINKGADINLVSRDGTPPLLIAILADAPNLVEYLLRRNADPNVKVDGVPLLSIAVMSSEDSIGILQELGARADVRDAQGVSPADLAAILGKPYLAKNLGGSDIGQPANEPPISLEAAIGIMDEDAIVEALKSESPNGTTDGGIPYIHFVAANTPSVRIFRHFLDRIDTDWAVKDVGGQNIIDAIMVNERRRIGSYMLFSLLTTRVSKVTQKRILLSTDDSGYSAVNRLLIADPELFLSIFDYATGASILNEIANTADENGVTPIHAAVITGNVGVLSKLLEKNLELPNYNPSLQETARSRRDWKVLAALPYDRNPPVGFEKGASKQVKMEMQKRLRDWGYYNGAVDGILGRGSRAALRAYFDDVESELRQMVEPNINIAESEVDRGDVYYSINYEPNGSWCRWRVIYWKQTAADNASKSERFIGCVKGVSRWNANGAGLVEYDETSTPELVFFGENGWDDEVEIK